MNHPLENAFDIDSGLDNTYETTVTIDDDPDLDTTINLALQAYKENAEIINMVDPKNRIRYMEIGAKYLDLAKDAMHKKESLEIQRMRAAGTKKTAKPEDAKSEEGINRNELFDQLKVVNGRNK